MSEQTERELPELPEPTSYFPSGNGHAMPRFSGEQMRAYADKRVEELTAENAALKKQNEEFRTLLAKSADQLAVWSKLAGALDSALEGEPR